MKKYLIGVLSGVVGGIGNTAFLFFAPNIENAVYISTFVTWLVIGLLIASSDFKLSGIFKGAIIAVLISLPSLIFTIVSSPTGAIWSLANAIIFGALMGFVIDKVHK